MREFKNYKEFLESTKHSKEIILENNGKVHKLNTWEIVIIQDYFIW